MLGNGSHAGRLLTSADYKNMKVVQGALVSHVYGYKRLSPRHLKRIEESLCVACSPTVGSSAVEEE